MHRFCWRTRSARGAGSGVVPSWCGLVTVVVDVVNLVAWPLLTIPSRASLLRPVVPSGLPSPHLSPPAERHACYFCPQSSRPRVYGRLSQAPRGQDVTSGRANHPPYASSRSCWSPPVSVVFKRSNKEQLKRFSQDGCAVSCVARCRFCGNEVLQPGRCPCCNKPAKLGCCSLCNRQKCWMTQY